MFKRPSFVQKLSILFYVFHVVVFSSACHFRESEVLSKNERLDAFPPVILWAWERPEDLRFLDTKKFGVAFLAQTLILNKNDVTFIPRRQPLEVEPETFLIAVTRIETVRTAAEQSLALSDAQKDKALNFIMQTLSLRNVKALQIDFDARASERNFYRAMLHELRQRLPENVSLTVTALASWCADDAWLGSLPVDEAVPMAFRMGLDNKTVREFLAAGNDWKEPLCRESYGIALDEPLKINFKAGRRFYVFHNRPWRAEDLKHLPEGVPQ